MLTEKEISLMTAEEISNMIKLLRTYQMKKGNVILNFFDKFIEPPDEYTLKELYQWYIDFYKGKKVPVDEITFRLKVINLIETNEISLSNLKFKQENNQIDKKDYIRDLGTAVSKNMI